MLSIGFDWPWKELWCSCWPCSRTKHLQNRAVGSHVQNLGVRGWSLFGKVGHIGGGPGQPESYCPRLEHARNGSIRDGFAFLARSCFIRDIPTTSRGARVDINLIILVLLFGSHPVHVPTLLLFGGKNGPFCNLSLEHKIKVFAFLFSGADGYKVLLT